MQFQRSSSTEFLVFAPTEAVRVAAWHALQNAGVKDVVIDAEKNVVVGTRGDGIMSVARTFSAVLTERNDGVLVSLTAKPVIGGTVDFGAGRKAAGKVGDALEQTLARQTEAAPSAPGFAAPLAVAAPIADPTGGAVVGAFSQPVYGPVLAPKRGTTLLVYGLLGMVCCQILAPFTIVYAFGALKDYRVNGDPGDRGLVVTSLVLGVIGCLLIVGRIVVAVSQR